MSQFIGANWSLRVSVQPNSSPEPDKELKKPSVGSQGSAGGSGLTVNCL